MADTATRLRILASVEGIQGFNQLKASLQGLAQQGSSTRYDLFKLTEAYGQLKRSGDSTIAGMRLQVQALTQLRENYKIGSTAFREYGAELDRVRAKLQATTREAAGGGAAGGGAGAGLIGGLAARFIAPIATGATVAAVGGAGMEAEAAQTRLKALTDQYGEYTKAQASAATVAQTLRLSTADAQGQFASLYASLRPVGVTVKEIEDAMIGFGAAARNSGATAQETSNAMIQLRQALASGVLQGEELRSIREQAPLVAQAIAKEMRVPIGALKDLAAEGKVTSDVVLRALGKLRDTQLGKLNAQFATTQQAVTDLGNAFKDTSAELFKIFAPTVISGLKATTAGIKSISTEVQILQNTEITRFFISLNGSLKPVVQTFTNLGEAIELASKPLLNMTMNPVILQALNLLSKAYGAATEGPRKLAAAGVPLTYKDATGNVYDTATGRRVGTDRGDVVSPEARAEQERARLEGLSRGAGGKKEEADKARKKQKQYAGTVIEYLTGDPTSKYYEPKGHGGANYHEHMAFQTKAQRDLAMRALQAEGIQIGSIEGGRHAAGSYHYSGQAFDVPAAQVPVGQERNLSARVRKILAQAGFTGKGLEGISATPKSATELGASLAEKELDAAQKAAKQRAEELNTYRETRSLQQAEINDKKELMQLQRTLGNAQTEEEKIRAQYALDYFNTYKNLSAEVEKLVDPSMALQLITATDVDMADRVKRDMQEIADLQTKQQAERDSAVWADQQLSLNEMLSQYYQQQSDKLQEQNVYAESLSQTLGQGMQQAFSLAIQGADDLSAKLQELGATVLKDIAQQLIQISIIAPIVRGIAGIGGGGGISPIAPGVGAAGGADFAKFFLQAGVSAFAGGGGGLPGVNFTGLGTTGFGFASGGIMTPQGPVPLRTYARGGIATAPQAAIYGEGSTPEAFVPLPDGRRIPVQLRQYPGIPGAPGTPGGFEQTDEVVRQLVTQARQDSTAAATTAAAAGGDGTMRIQLETTRINSVDYITAEQAAALANAAAARSTARQQRALQASPGARRGIGI